MGGLCPSFAGPCGCMPLPAATAVAPPRQTCLSRFIFLSVHTLPSLLILKALGLNFPQIFQFSPGNNMARIKHTRWSPSTGGSGGISSSLPVTLSHTVMGGVITGLAFTFLSLSPPWHSAFLLALFLPLPQGLSIFEHRGGGVGWWMIHPRCVSHIFQIKSLFTSCTVSKS